MNEAKADRIDSTLQKNFYERKKKTVSQGSGVVLSRLDATQSCGCNLLDTQELAFLHLFH